MSEIKSRAYFFLTGKRATQNLKKLTQFLSIDMSTYYHEDKKEPKWKMMILAPLCTLKALSIALDVF